MANVLSTLFQDIANAIRSKNGDTDKMKPIDFPEAILSIEGGGGGIPDGYIKPEGTLQITENGIVDVSTYANAEVNVSTGGGGGGSGELVPLKVTKNGMYYPPTGNVEIGGTYTFKDSYTQDELKVFYDAYYDETEDAAILYMNGESYGVAITSVPLDDAVRYMLAVMNGEGNFIYVTEEIASALGFGVYGWLLQSDDSAPVSADTPTITFEESGTLYVPSLSDLKSLFTLSNADGFSEVTVNVASGGGGGSGELVPLTVTKNGMYYPPTGNVEIGGTYTFKDSYTQEELQALHSKSTNIVNETTAILISSIGTLGIMYQYGMYIPYYYGYTWVPGELAPQIGSTEGWHQGEDLTSMVKVDAPTFTSSEYYDLYVDDITSLNVLFELPSADGFSSVEVKVDRENDDTYAIHEFKFTAESKEQFVTWDLGYVPDITIMTPEKPPVAGSIVMFIIYNRAMLSKLPEGEGGRFKFTINNPDLVLAGNQPLLRAFEDDMDQSYRVFGHPRLATGEGFLVGIGADNDTSKYGLTPGAVYVVMTINGIT